MDFSRRGSLLELGAFAKRTNKLTTEDTEDTEIRENCIGHALCTLLKLVLATLVGEKLLRKRAELYTKKIQSQVRTKRSRNVLNVWIAEK